MYYPDGFEEEYPDKPINQLDREERDNIVERENYSEDKGN